MKLPLTQILILGFFSVLLSFPTAEGLTCHQCYSIKKDNKCKRPSLCHESTHQFCFIQRISKGGYIRRISQGCTSYCVDAVRFTNAFIKYTFCCRTDYCNKHNVWQFR